MRVHAFSIGTQLDIDERTFEAMCLNRNPDLCLKYVDVDNANCFIIMEIKSEQTWLLTH